MPSRKPRSPQGETKNYRIWRKQLKEIGLFGKSTSLRAKITPAQKAKINKYKDILTGDAKAFNMPVKDARKIRKLYGLSGTGETVIVPKKKGERITFSKKTDEITIKRKDGRKTVYSPDVGARPVPPGKRLFYTLEFARGKSTERYRFEDYAELERFMKPYEEKQKNAWKNWRSYIVLDYLDKDETSRGKNDKPVATGRVSKTAGRAAKRPTKKGTDTKKRSSAKTGKTKKRGKKK